MDNSQKPHFQLLDSFRAGAAFLVLFEHARNYLLVDYQAAPGCGVLWKIAYCLSGMGHDAVVIFFALSGCLVGMVVVRDVGADRWDWKRYLFSRLTRLWLVLLPALVLTVIFDAGSGRFAPEGSFVFTGAFANIQALPLGAKMGSAILLGNALFLQTIVVPTLGSNGPLWSLAYEFWYYLIFPLLYVASFGRGTPGRRLGYLALGALALIFVGPTIAIYFLVWLMGVGAFVLFRKQRVSLGLARWGLALASISLAGAMIAHRFGLLDRVLPGFWSIAAIGAVCAATLYFAMQVTVGEVFARVSHWFSKFSYTLYLVHLPFLTFGVSFFIRNNGDRLHPSPAAACVLVGAILLAYAFGYVVYLGTEKHTDAVRRWLAGRWAFFSRSA